MTLLNSLKSLIHTIKFIYNHPLNKPNKFEALGRFFNWQFFLKHIRQETIIPWISDSKLILRKGEAAVTGNYYTGLMEYEEMSFLLDTLRPEDIFVDVGANSGTYTVLASKVVGAKTIAFEPILKTFKRLKKNITLNSIENKVTLRYMGVGEKKGYLNFTNDSDTTNKVSFDKNLINKQKVKVIKLDDELKSKNYFLKIDVEGFEMKVIKGAKNLLASNKVKAIIIELNESSKNFGSNNQSIHKFLISYKFIPISYHPSIKKIIKIKTYNKNNRNNIYI